jgi:hypothetical protein
MAVPTKTQFGRRVYQKKPVRIAVFTPPNQKCKVRQPLLNACSLRAIQRWLGESKAKTAKINTLLLIIYD